MLENAAMVGFIATNNAEKALPFYRDILGLELIEQTPVALIFKCANSELRITITPPFTPLPFTVLGWQVADIAAQAQALADHGISGQQFDGMDQDDHGIWTTPAGAKVLWIKDPDGNLLSLTEG